MFWNEPNNMSHWDFEIDPGWEIFAKMVNAAADAIARGAPGAAAGARRDLADRPEFIRNMQRQGVLEHVDVVAVHGFPLDWNHWQIHEWPDKLAEIRAVTDLPVWVSEVGVSTFGAEEVQEFGLKRTAELLIGAGRAHPLVQPVRPAAGVAGDDAAPRGGGVVVLPALLHGADARGRVAEARAAAVLAIHAGAGNLPVVPLRGPPARRPRCAGCKELGVKYLRTGLSWADSFRPTPTPGSIGRCGRSSHST